LKSKKTDKKALAEKLERKVRMQQCLPHLYGFPWYKWAWEFFTSKNKHNFLVAANQISKSSTQIRKGIHWATEPELWDVLWDTKPTQFWYFYPTKEVATIEFHEKWVKEFLPREEFREHPQYGWRADIRNKNIFAIYFNTGVSIYFKSYEQSADSLQTATVYAMFCDEEMPEQLYDELIFRLNATDGYFHMVFTATLGQEFWRCTMEERGKYEKFKSAFKRNISMYDCQKYMDGTDSHWTLARIKEKEANCSSEAERLRRIMGRFVKDSDLKYAGFDRTRNVSEDHKLPSNWLIYTGVDIGSGGTTSHPAATVFVAVDPNFTKGRVFKCWRGDGCITTASDLLEKYIELKGKMKPVAQYYDWASKDFGVISERWGEAFMPADKSRESGEKILNVLFKTGMLKIYKTEESLKLVHELENLSNKTIKNNSKDDLIDALRYAVTKIPWDFSNIHTPKSFVKVDPYKDMTERERLYHKQKDERTKGIEHIVDQSEFDEWNDMYENMGMM